MIWSIGTTIWDIGHLVTDERKLQFWSNRACMFHHPYPVGYRASKYHFGREYWMTIEADEDGPIFTVFTEDRQHNFEGRTPTQPWTQACLASTTKGTRISGPLFFGFSDPLTQLLIQQLHGYQSWEDLHAEAATAMAPTAAATTTTTAAATTVSTATPTELLDSLTSVTTTKGRPMRNITQLASNVA
ncbi:hypothetical protein BDF19DRAFT_497896 [Syncephalis fuscata]|nr:hypothetical protein BDF19DRAFT_497896 [Syncephalis fuscata]